MRREVSTSEDEENSSQPEGLEPQSEDEISEEEVVPEPEPEDPLDVEERELNQQLM